MYFLVPTLSLTLKRYRGMGRACTQGWPPVTAGPDLPSKGPDTEEEVWGALAGWGGVCLG